MSVCWWVFLLAKTGFIVKDNFHSLQFHIHTQKSNLFSPPYKCKASQSGKFTDVSTFSAHFFGFVYVLYSNKKGFRVKANFNLLHSQDFNKIIKFSASSMSETASLGAIGSGDSGLCRGWVAFKTDA